MSEEMLERNPWLDSTKRAVIKWVKEHVGIKGEDAIFNTEFAQFTEV